MLKKLDYIVFPAILSLLLNFFMNNKIKYMVNHYGGLSCALNVSDLSRSCDLNEMRFDETI